ncbi:hypothetical protein ACFOEQ_27210 [Chryseobacterium arachidis]|uniref:hypothetical protein n=1 Tax=Chryseobacterium arachidis TaxID=1416778 RepID=UPI00361419B6
MHLIELCTKFYYERYILFDVAPGGRHQFSRARFGTVTQTHRFQPMDDRNFFSKSMLPQSLISPFSYILPVAEFTIGILLILGIFSPKVIIAGFVVMIILMFGTCLIENWEALPSQMMHAIILVVLYQFISANSISLDQFFKK